MPEPFMLYVSKRFLDRASKAFGLGLIVRKPLVEFLKRMNVPLRELGTGEAKEALNRVYESGITVGQVAKSLALALFVPTGILTSTMKKVIYRSGVETEDAVMLEFLVEVPKMFKTLFYDMWLILPKTEAANEKTKQLMRKIVEKAGTEPLSEEEWEDLQPVVEKLRGKLEVRGATENLWKTI